MAISAIEKELLSILIQLGPIRGTAQVGFALWPDRLMQPQGAAVAAGKVLRGLRDRGMISAGTDAKLSLYTITEAGRRALLEHQAASVDPRQLSLLPD